MKKLTVGSRNWWSWLEYAQEEYARQRRSWRSRDVKNDMKSNKVLFIGGRHLIKNEREKYF